MRTSVYTNPFDPDETDEFPGCAGNVEDTGALIVVDFATSGVEAEYRPGEWVSYDTTAEG